MDKALKQRLVGATVLIALAVIVLPMLLSGPTSNGGRAPTQKIELPPRPDDVTFETRRFPLGETEASADASGAGSAAEAADGADDEPAGRNRLPMPDPAPSDGTAPDTSAPSQPQRAAASDDSGAMPAPVVEDEPAPVVEIRPRDSSPGDSGQPTTEDRYVVQVASLGSDANARRLMNSLEQAGMAVLLDSVESDVGRLSRVRVGPYGTESSARDAARRVRDAIEGVSPRVVDLQPDAASPVSNPADPMVRWVVQVGSFSEADNAEGLVEQLRAGGLTAYRETVTSSGSAIHRVRVGPYLRREDALAARQKVIDAHSLEGVVMSAE